MIKKLTSQYEKVLVPKNSEDDDKTDTGCGEKTLCKSYNYATKIHNTMNIIYSILAFISSCIILTGWR